MRLFNSTARPTRFSIFTLPRVTSYMMSCANDTTRILVASDISTFKFEMGRSYFTSSAWWSDTFKSLNLYCFMNSKAVSKVCPLGMSSQKQKLHLYLWTVIIWQPNESFSTHTLHIQGLVIWDRIAFFNNKLTKTRLKPWHSYHCQCF